MAPFNRSLEPVQMSSPDHQHKYLRNGKGYDRANQPDQRLPNGEEAEDNYGLGDDIESNGDKRKDEEFT